MTAKEAFKNWLAGTTCRHHYMSVFWEQGDYFILKHHGHSEYCGRFIGSKRCGTYYDLYHKDAPPKGPFPTPVYKWGGRWINPYWDQVSELIGEMAYPNKKRYVVIRKPECFPDQSTALRGRALYAYSYGDAWTRFRWDDIMCRKWYTIRQEDQP